MLDSGATDTVSDAHADRRSACAKDRLLEVRLDVPRRYVPRWEVRRKTWLIGLSSRGHDTAGQTLNRPELTPDDPGETRG